MFVGHFYQHPEQGAIYVTRGSMWINNRLSNFFNWIVVETGEEKSGYGGDWPCVDKDWEISFRYVGS